MLQTAKIRGGFRGGGEADAPSSGIRPPADPKGLPFDTFQEIHFWPTDPKIFLRAPSAPILTIFLAAFFNCFSKFCLRRRKFFLNRGKTMLWEISKNQFGRPKKKGRQNFRKFFENPPPPLEKILDPPLAKMVCSKYVFVVGTYSRS